MTNKIYGTIKDAATGNGVGGLRVQAWDQDWPDGDDFMGQTLSRVDGGYEIPFTPGRWDEGFNIFDFGLPDIYLAVENKNSKGRWVRIAESQVCKNQDMSQDLKIDMEVIFGPTDSRQTNFRPDEHGFGFINNFKVVPDILGIDLGIWDMGFCGGMCAGALYRFRKGLPVPLDKVAPSDGTPLHEELMKRQIIAMSPKMLPKMYDWQAAPEVPAPMRKTSIGERTRDEWPKLRNALDSTGPAILVLIRSSGYFGNPTDNHQVLAIGYEYNPGTMDLVIFTYDPNIPNVTNSLSLNVGLPEGKLYLKDSASRKTRGFFVNMVGEDAVQKVASFS
jgi:hypothetical protein